MSPFRSSRREPDDGADEAIAAPASHDTHPPPTIGRPRTFSSLAIADYRMLWFGMLFSMAALQVDVVARPWLAYAISGSGLTLGLVSLARGVPQLFASLAGGVVADRLDKRKVLVISQCALGVLALVNAVLVQFGVVEIWHLIVLGALQGMVFPMNVTVRQAMVPELVGRKHLANAMAINSAGLNLNRVLAPVLAGLLIAWDPAVAFFAIAVFFGLAALTMARLPQKTAAPAKTSGALADLLAGFRYIWATPMLRSLIGIAFVPIMVGMPFMLLLPVFQADVLHVGPPELGLMYTAVGVGSLAGSLLFARFSDHRRRRQLQVIAGIAFGITLALFALSTSYWLSLAILLIVGFSSQSYMTINSMLIVVNTDRKLYGRVQGIYMVTWSLMPVSVAPLGALVDTVGPQLTLAGAGSLVAAFIAVMTLLYRDNWRVEGPPGSAEQRSAGVE